MATTRISAPLRGVSQQLSRLSIRQPALPARCTVRCALCRPIFTTDDRIEIDHLLLCPPNHHIDLRQSRCLSHHYLRRLLCTRQATGRAESARDHPPIPFPRAFAIRGVPRESPVLANKKRHSSPRCHLRG